MNKVYSEALFDEQTKHFSQKLLGIRSWSINKISYPILDITFTYLKRIPFRVRMICEDYDELPCSIELLAANGEYLKIAPIGSSVINRGKHHNTNRPFICSPGSREYHTHNSHKNDSWDNYKGKSSYDIGGMITQIHNAWLKTRDVT